jgi:type VI protein secretion system component VasF
MTKRAKRPAARRERRPIPPTPAQRAIREAEDAKDQEVLDAYNRRVVEAAEHERKWREGERRRAVRRRLLVWTAVLCAVAVAVTVWALNH